MKSLAHATFKNLSHDQLAYDESHDGPPLSRITLRREFHGELEGESSAELQACQPAQGQFSYVGSDRFAGRLKDRSGTFVFQHGGTYESDSAKPFGYIVPGSGTGELNGIRGEVVISVTPTGEHSIDLTYELD